jgi:hypothetical protein
MQDPFSKITRGKKAGGVGQTVELLLPHQHEVLSSIPGTIKKKKRRKAPNNKQQKPQIPTAKF